MSFAFNSVNVDGVPNISLFPAPYKCCLEKDATTEQTEWQCANWYCVINTDASDSYPSSGAGIDFLFINYILLSVHLSCHVHIHNICKYVRNIQKIL